MSVVFASAFAAAVAVRAVNRAGDLSPVAFANVVIP